MGKNNITIKCETFLLNQLLT
jgi:hypothetical protein